LRGPMIFRCHQGLWGERANRGQEIMTPGGWVCGLAAELRISILFCTRLPLAHAMPIAGGDVARASWAIPIAGALVGGIGALAYWAGYQIGLPPLPAAALALAATAAITGCLHEDGLADTVDGFGGGKDPEHKLAIMRDSRLGTFGACALAASFILRWSALASIADPLPVAMALIAAHASARAALPMFMRLVRPARRDGLSAHAGRPPWESAAAACVVGALALLGGLGPIGAIAGLLLLTCASTAMAWLSVQEIGGQTGDVVGALEQVNEILILLAAAIVLKPHP
jgi:adenosylcobinamide-GDP ribazoletransferase